MVRKNLKCPFCGYIWTPRVKSPRACPRCKRQWTEERRPEFVEVEVSQEWLMTPPEPGVSDLERPYYNQCGVCRDRLGYDIEGPYIWQGGNYCLRHCLEAITLYDEKHRYNRPDPVGHYSDERNGIRRAILDSLEQMDTQREPEPQK